MKFYQGYKNCRGSIHNDQGEDLKEGPSHLGFRESKSVLHKSFQFLIWNFCSYGRRQVVEFHGRTELELNGFS